MFLKSISICCLAGLMVLSGAACGDDTARTPVLVDVRTPAEYSAGHLQGAVNIEYQRIVGEIKKYVAHPNTPIELYCRSGGRSGIAAAALRRANYQDVTNLGGFESLRQRGYRQE